MSKDGSRLKRASYQSGKAMRCRAAMWVCFDVSYVARLLPHLFDQRMNEFTIYTVNGHRVKFVSGGSFVRYNGGYHYYYSPEGRGELKVTTGRDVWGIRNERRSRARSNRENRYSVSEGHTRKERL